MTEPPWELAACFLGGFVLGVVVVLLNIWVATKAGR